MPVIRYVPCDPTDVVVQGSLLHSAPVVLTRLDGQVTTPNIEAGAIVVVLGEPSEEGWWPDPPKNLRLLRASDFCPMSNATIITPCGTSIDTFMTGRPTLGAPMMSTTQWAIVGTTLDAADAPLPGCRVIVLEYGRLAVGESPVVADVISSEVDGTFSIPVAGNSGYQIIAYKPGVPDVAGITLSPLTPTMI